MTVNLAWRNAMAETNSACVFGFNPAAEAGFVEYLPLELIARFQIDYRPPQRLAPDRFTKYAEYDPLPGRLLDAFTSHMQAACKSGELPFVRAPDLAISNSTIQQVSAQDFAAWLALQGEEPSAHIVAWFKANGVADSASNDTTPDPERRLARLRALGGNAAGWRSGWKFTGMAALVASEKSEGRTRCDEKTIRADLREAAQNEFEAKRAGFVSGLGQR